MLQCAVVDLAVVSQVFACLVCCSVLQCAAVCCSVLQCVAVCCSVLQCVAVDLTVVSQIFACLVCCSVLQYVAVCCSVLQSSQLYLTSLPVSCCSVLQSIAQFDLSSWSIQSVAVCWHQGEPRLEMFIFLNESACS